MSRFAVFFVALTLMLISIDLLLPIGTDAMSYVARIAAGFSFAALVIALMIGRRFKFDPVLR